MALIELLRKRYACKAYDPTRRIERTKVDNIIEAMRLAPTSLGLQPFSIVEVESSEARAKLAEASFKTNAALIQDASHVFVIAAWDNYTKERISAVYDQHIAERPSLSERYNRQRDGVLPVLLSPERSVGFADPARQTYIALGLALAQAEAEGVNATPIEGFDSAKATEVLGLGERGLVATLILTVGYSAGETDYLRGQKQVRRPIAEMLIRL